MNYQEFVSLLLGAFVLGYCLSYGLSLLRRLLSTST